MNPPVHFLRQMFLRSRAKLLVAHDTVDDFVVTFHPPYEQIVEDTAKEGGEVGLIVRFRRFDDLLVALPVART